MTVFQFRIEPAVLSALAHANKCDAGYDFIVGDGDLLQMGQQFNFLRTNGFDVGRRDVYPAVRTEAERKQAYEAMWKARVPGWWNMHAALLRENICTEEEFQQALNQEL
jgi:hypothetical protein